MNDDLRKYALALAAQMGVDPTLVDAIGSAESGWKPDAVSPKGALGPMQLMPATAKELGVNPADPYDNVRGGVTYLKRLHDQFGGDPSLVAAAYNAGPGAVQKAGGVPNYPETQKYVQKVTKGLEIDPSKVVLDQHEIDPSKVVLDQPAEKVGALDAAAIGAGRTVDRLAAGLRQATPEPIRNGIDWLNNKLGMGQPPSIDPAVQADNTRMYDQVRQAQPVASFAGEVAPALAAVNPLAMAGVGGLEYGTPEERAIRAGLGYAGGKVGQAIGSGIGRLVGPRSAGGVTSDVGDFIVDSASNKWGIPTTVGQTGSKPAQIAESVLSNLPMSAGVIGKARDRSFQGFNQAVSDTFGGDAFGNKAAQLTPEILGEAKSRIGQVFNDVSARNSMSFDDPLFNDLLRISQRAKTDLTPEQGNLVVNWVNNIVRDVNPESMTVAGKTYKAYDSTLGKLAKSSGGTLGDVFGDLRYTLRSAMDRSISPEDAAKWATARKQYLNLQTVADAGKNALTGEAEGNLSPARLLQAVNSAQKNAKFGSGNDLAELAQWAKGTLPDKIPNSGTAQRQFYQRLLTNPLSTGAAIGGAAYGADKAGIDPSWALALGMPYVAARGLAGAPLSREAAEALKRSAGLLGFSTSAYLQR